MSAVFYWYPDAGGTLETLTLTAGAVDPTELQEGEAAIMGAAESASGVLYRVFFGMRYPVRIEIDAVSASNTATRRALRNMLNHLNRGNHVGFALDATKAWGSFVAVPPGGPARGATSITGLQRQAWYSASASLASGDEIVLESGDPVHQVEETTTTATVANSATSISCSAITSTFTACHVRYRDFWPVLVMLPDEVARADRILSAKRLWYDIKLNFVYDLAAVMALAGPGPVVRQSGDAKGVRQSLEEAIAGVLNNAPGARGFGGFNA